MKRGEKSDNIWWTGIEQTLNKIKTKTEHDNSAQKMSIPIVCKHVKYREDPHISVLISHVAHIDYRRLPQKYNKFTRQKHFGNASKHVMA